MTDHRRAAVRLPAIPGSILRAALLVAGALFSTSVLSQEPEPAERGIFVTVTNPITSEVVNGIKERIVLRSWLGLLLLLGFRHGVAGHV